MSFTVADVVKEARELLLDELTPYRYSDDYIVRKTNQILKRMAVIRPDLFTAVADMTTVAGTLQQCPTDSIRLMDVITNGDGRAPKEIDQDALDLLQPSWNTEAAGPTVNWMRVPRDPSRFYVYPPSPGNETLTILYSRSLPDYAAGDTVNLQDAYFPTVLDGVCWLMESLDAEHVESGRAKMFQESYNNSLAGSLLSRNIGDTEAAGVGAKANK